MLSCPLEPVIDQLPTSGFVLDVGCGHGLIPLLAAANNPDLHVLGIDLDNEKVQIALTASDHLGLNERAQFLGSSAADIGVSVCDRGAPDAVMCVDVLYLLGLGDAIATVEAMATCIRPGGIVVIKEMSDAPRWKARCNHLQELVATRLLLYTRGHKVAVIPPGVIRSTLEAAGLIVEEVALDRHSVHPHRLFIGRA